MHLRALLLPVLLIALSAAPAAAGDSRLLRADTRGVSFEQTTSVDASAIAPRTVWIAVPDGMTVEVASAVLTEETLAGLSRGPGLFGAATATATDDADPGGAPERALALGRLLAETAPPGAPHARLVGVTGLRGLRVAAIEILPAAYDPAGDRLRVSTRLSVDCAFVPVAGASPPAAVAPPSPVFAAIERELLLNFASADAFRRHAGGGRARPQALADGPLVNAIEVRVASKGVHEITGADLEAAGVTLEDLSPSNVRLFTRPGLPLLAEDAVGPAYERREVSLRVEDGDDGRFDATDRILFYGVGPSGWFDDYGVAGADTLDWLQHSYETHNVYELSFRPQPGDPPVRWATRDVAPNRTTTTVVDRYRARMHFEDDLVYVPDSDEPGRPWNPWAWKNVHSAMAASEVSLHADGVIPATAARVQARFWGRRPTTSDPLRLEMSLNGQPIASRSWTGGPPQVIDTTGTWLVDGDNRLAVRLLPPANPNNGIQSGSFMTCDLVLDRRLQVVGDTLEFTAPDAVGDLAYAVAPFGDATGLTLLDVSDPLRPVELRGWSAADTTGGQAVRFHDARPGARYFAAAATARRRPALAPSMRRDLRAGGADYLVIYADPLEGAAYELAHHRREEAPPFPGATTAAVNIRDIFAAYSGGRMDPAAIRNFLYDAVNGGTWSPAPSFVCLLGDATYDHRDILRLGGDLGRTQVPTFQRNFYALGQFSSDDWLADLDVGPADTSFVGDVPDLVLGRLPAANAAEAAVLIDKVRQYDRPTAGDSYPRSGEWRNRLLWLVDDASQGTQPDPLGAEFTRHAEELDRDHLPPWLERIKVNLLEYPLVDGRVKPGAQEKTIEELRRGALVWFYVGRANPFKLADENAFVLADVAALGNGTPRPFFIANTSSVGPFDIPWNFPFLGEAMVKDPNGGSIATYSATEDAFAFAGRALSQALLDALFAPDRLDEGRTIGEAAFVAGRRSGGSRNDRLFQLLGDPGTRLATARYDVRLACFDDETGEALPDSLPRGRLVRVETEVHRTRDPAVSDLATDYDGHARFRITDSPPLWPIPSGPFGPEGETYAGTPRDAALAEGAIHGGRGSARFVVPLAATPGPDARLQAYVEGRDAFASGAHRYVLGDAQPDPADRTGPTIIIQLGGIYGPVHPSSENFAVFLLDSSGVRTLVDSTRHRITLSLDGAPATDVSADVRPFGGRHDVFSLFPSFTSLDDGMHTVRVEASDNLAVADEDLTHRTVAEVSFRVAAVVASNEPRGLAFPNPFTRAAGTLLAFTGLRGGSHDVADVQIHDIRGRRLRTLHGRGGGSGIQVPWDGRDDAGRALPAGVYPWRAMLSLYGGITKEYSGRLVLLD